MLMRPGSVSFKGFSLNCRFYLKTRNLEPEEMCISVGHEARLYGRRDARFLAFASFRENDMKTA